MDDLEIKRGYKTLCVYGKPDADNEILIEIADDYDPTSEVYLNIEQIKKLRDHLNGLLQRYS